MFFLQTNGSGVLSFVSSGGKFESALLHVRDEKASGTQGGSSTSGSFQTRTLNTVVTNEISGASLSSNQIVLPSGTYFIYGTTPVYAGDQIKTKLRNITDSTDAIIGGTDYTVSGYGGYCRSIISGRFTISAQKTFEIQNRVGTSNAVTGYGVTSSFSLTEVYSDVQIWKVA